MEDHSDQVVDRSETADTGEEGPDAELANEIHASTPHDAIRHWLKCLCHWQLMLNDISSGYLRKLLSHHRLQITTIPPPQASEPKSQASLKATLDSLGLSQEDRRAALETLRVLAEEQIAAIRARRTPAAKNTKQHEKRTPTKVEQKWNALLGDGNAWAGLFTGRIHCEVSLACILEMTAEQRQAAGIKTFIKVSPPFSSLDQLQ